jgi:hypothetical protein
MPGDALDLSTNADWIQIYDTTLLAQPVGGMTGKYYPIPNHQVPVSIDRHILAVGSSSTKVKPTWNLGFYLVMVVAIPGIGMAEAISVPIRLGLTLVRFPQIASEFKVKARIPRWHQEMSMTLWKYALSDSVANLAEIDATTKRIEFKIDASHQA